VEVNPFAGVCRCFYNYCFPFFRLFIGIPSLQHQKPESADQFTGTKGTGCIRNQFPVFPVALAGWLHELPHVPQQVILEILQSSLYLVLALCLIA